MKKIFALGAAAALAFTPVAFAQQAPTQPPAAAPAPQANPATPDIQSVSIVDITELPAPTQAEVNEQVSKSSQAELKQLRDNIDANPDIKAALTANGVTSEQVVAVSMAQNGTLTLITKKSG